MSALLAAALATLDSLDARHAASDTLDSLDSRYDGPLHVSCDCVGCLAGTFELAAHTQGCAFRVFCETDMGWVSVVPRSHRTPIAYL